MCDEIILHTQITCTFFLHKQVFTSELKSPLDIFLKPAATSDSNAL